MTDHRPGPTHNGACPERCACALEWTSVCGVSEPVSRVVCVCLSAFSVARRWPARAPASPAAGRAVHTPRTHHTSHTSAIHQRPHTRCMVPYTDVWCHTSPIHPARLWTRPVYGIHPYTIQPYTPYTIHPIQPPLRESIPRACGARSARFLFKIGQCVGNITQQSS